MALIFPSGVNNDPDLPERQRISECVRTTSAEIFCEVFQDLLRSGKPITEKLLKTEWTKAMWSNKSLLNGGSYQNPWPQEGVSVLMGTESDLSRINFSSLRPPELDASADIELNRETGLLNVYSSAVHAETAIGGDWGATLYWGKDATIREVLTTGLKTNQLIAPQIEVGMTFHRVYELAMQVMEALGVTNKVGRQTAIDDHNIGHTIQGGIRPWREDEIRALNSTHSMQGVGEVLSASRLFVKLIQAQTDHPNEIQDGHVVVTPNMSFTIEPRPFRKDERGPISSMHTMLQVDAAGNPRLIENFERLFRMKEIGMNWILQS